MDRNCAAARCFDVGHHCLGGNCRRAVTDRHPGAVACQAPGGGGADAARTTVDESDFTVQIGVHDVFPFDV